MAECGVCAETIALTAPVAVLACLHRICVPCAADIVEEARQKQRKPACLSCGENFDEYLVLQNDDEGDQDLPNCPQHVAEPLSVFCHSCQVTICEICTESQHSSHVLTRNFMDKLEERQVELKKQLTWLDEAQLQLKAVESALKQRIETLKTEIDNAFDSLVVDDQEQLDTRRHALQANAALEIKTDLKTIELQCRALDPLYEHVNAALLPIGKADVALRYAVSLRVQHLLLQTSKHSFDTVFSPMVHDTLRFTFRRPFQLVNRCIDTIGMLARVQQDYTTMNRNVFAFDIDKSIMDIAYLPAENRLVLANVFDGRLDIISLTGEPIRQIKTTPLLPAALAVTPTGDIWITAPQEFQIACYSSVTGAQLRNIQKIRAFGLTVTTDGFLFAACLSHRTRAFRPDGSPLWQSSAMSFRDAVGVAITPDNRSVIVCDRSKGIFQIDSETGIVMQRLVANSISGMLNGPRQIAIIPGTDTFVVTDSQFLSIWTFDGQLVHRWGRHSSRMFSGVTVLSDGRIAALDRTFSKIQIFS